METAYSEYATDTLGLWRSRDRIETACIVVPTYNEAKNIVRLLDAIFEQEGAQPIMDAAEIHVLVVDDNSPDGTAGVVRDYQRRHKRVHLMVRRNKEGLGRAYIAGMQHALDVLDPDIVFEMDADLSHDPADIPRMIAAIRDGEADMVIGSRYVDGGKIPEDWGMHRKLTSACANLATRWILGIDGIKDCSGGFRAFRKDILRKVELESLQVKGYAFQAVLLEAVLHHGGRVLEIPIEFSDREEGDSKMRVRDMVEGFSVFAEVRARRLMPRLRMSK